MKKNKWISRDQLGSLDDDGLKVAVKILKDIILWVYFEKLSEYIWMITNGSGGW